ncbi:MAG: M23 family metallopeptidase [Myxococcota bacterium]
MTTTEAGDASCGLVRIRRTALGARWGEYLRVRVDTEATLIGQAKLMVAGREERARPFVVSGKDLVLEGRWVNEKLTVPSALPKGAALEVALEQLTPAAGDCRRLAFTVEQGAVVPDVGEAQWLAELERREGVTGESPSRAKSTVAGRPRPASADAKPAAEEWAKWSAESSDRDPSEWVPWPLASRFSAPRVGTPLAKGVWLAWSAEPASSRRVAEELAEARKVGPLDAPEQMAALVDRVRSEVETDDAAALMLFAGEAPALRATVSAGAEAPLSALARHLSGKERPALVSVELALQLATAFSLGWPVASGTPVTSPFGLRVHPILGKEQLHTGVDLPVPIGTLVAATGAGVVVRAGETKVNGRYVVIDHGHGVTTAYLHNARVLVSEGQQVNAGDFIAMSGNTGRSTGPHVHYQLELSGQPVDPLYFYAPAPVATAAR